VIGYAVQLARDLNKLAKTAQEDQAIKQAVFREASKFTDESYMRMFLDKADLAAQALVLKVEIISLIRVAISLDGTRPGRGDS
jgi:hypothetical protein